MTPEKRQKLRKVVKALVHGEMPLLEHLLTHRVMLMLDAAEELQSDTEPFAWAVCYTRTVTGEHATDFYPTYASALAACIVLQQATPPMEATLTPLYAHHAT